jgi:hypothetical protein
MMPVMAKPVGRSIALSPYRRLVTDLMHFSQRVPAVTVERRMSLAEIVKARARCPARPGWAVLIAKAFALVARTRPELRRAFMTFPRPRFYEHPYSTVALNVERQMADELVVVQCLIRQPDNRSLAELDGIVRHYQAEPVENLRWYARAVAMSRVPWPVRPFVWWATLNLFGRRRCHNFGTFGLSSVAAQGAGLVTLVPLLTSTLHYGLLDEAGNLDMRMTWDHRVMDGALCARILAELERTLHDDILTELNDMARPVAGDQWPVAS